MIALDADALFHILGNRLGQHDLPCPACGPHRKGAANRRRKVLRVWHHEPGFLTYYCARCGWRGSARSDADVAVDSARITELRRRSQQRNEEERQRRRELALSLWRRRLPAADSPVERYLAYRGHSGPVPATLGFLPAGKPDHHPAMIAAFGMPGEPEPGALNLEIDAVTGVHLTLLKPNGSGKAGTGRDKLMIGRSLGSPVVLAPMNDLLGLIVCEGIEDGLSLHAATGLGVWAAGCANRLPALADAIPACCEWLTIVADPDIDGRRHAAMLKAKALVRGIHAEAVCLEAKEVARASRRQ